MIRIDTPNSVNGRWKNGNPLVGIKGTFFGALWQNNVQEEIAAPIEYTGRALDGSNERQLLDSILDLIDQSAGSGLTTDDRRAIDASVPLGGPLPPFLELWNVSDWQTNESFAGMKMTPDGGPVGQFLPVGGGTVPARFLVNGGVIRIYATGTFTPGSLNPVLGAQLYVNGTLKRPYGALGALGWAFSNGTSGSHILGAVRADSRWILSLEVLVLGERAAQHSAITFGTDAKMISRGFLEVGEFSKGEGDQAGALVNTGSTGENQSRGGHWISGETYTPELGKLVVHHGQVWRCIAEHVASSQNEPGAGAALAGPTSPYPEYLLYWAPHRLRYNIWNPHALDELGTQDLEVELRMGAPAFSDVLTVPQWSSLAVTYNEHDVVHTGGDTRFAARQPPSHVSSAATEPGVGVDWERVWRQLDDHGQDHLHVDYTHAHVIGGGHGFEPRSF